MKKKPRKKRKDCEFFLSSADRDSGKRCLSCGTIFETESGHPVVCQQCSKYTRYQDVPVSQSRELECKSFIKRDPQNYYWQSKPGQRI